MTITFEALADARRREIIDLLRDEELSVNDLAGRLPIAQSGVSRHLRILREAGFVQARAEAQQRLYSLRPEPFEELDAWLSRYRQLWEQRLNNFEAVLAQRVAASPSAASPLAASPPDKSDVPSDDT